MDLTFTARWHVAFERDPEDGFAWPDEMQARYSTYVFKPDKVSLSFELSTDGERLLDGGLTVSGHRLLKGGRLSEHRYSHQYYYHRELPEWAAEVAKHARLKVLEDMSMRFK